MQNEFEMSMMGELNFFLGLQIKQTKNRIFISQSKYCKELINRFRMENAKHMVTPMSIAFYLDKDEIGQSIDMKKYRGMIVSLPYLSASRPDIMFNIVCVQDFKQIPNNLNLVQLKES